MEKLLIAIIGERNAGKSTIWYELFGRGVSTGTTLREVALFDGLVADVFLVNGSPQERGLDIKRILQGKPQIVLCSIQYVEDAFSTFDYFVKNEYRIMAMWLNPGHNANHIVPAFDTLGMMNYLMARNATIALRSAKGRPQPLALEIRTWLHGWAVGSNIAFRPA